MRQDIALRWAERLESGQDKQGRTVLRRGDELCCLGVLCEIAVEDGVIPEPSCPDGNWTMGKYFYGANGNDCTLPREVMAWADILDPVPDFGRHTFAAMNDALGWDFPTIATQVRLMANLPAREVTSEVPEPEEEVQQPG